jgi:hypothetical protein
LFLDRLTSAFSALRTNGWGASVSRKHPLEGGQAHADVSDRWLGVPGMPCFEAIEFVGKRVELLKNILPHIRRNVV